MDIIDLTKKLISIPSQIGQTTEIENYIASYLENIPGAEVELQPVPGHGNNVIARSIHNPSNPTILINGHLDTVEICKGWTKEPLEPVIDGDKLYGLGSADMQSGIAIGLKAFEALAKLDNINIIFAGTVDEEGDSTGAFTMINNGIKADLCLIPEPSNGTLMMGCRGRVVFQVDVRGSSAHGAKPQEGVNAITEASKLVGKLKELPLLEHPQLSPGTLCILEFQGRTKTLSVPDFAQMKIDRHYVIGETKENMLDDLKKAVMKLNSPASFDISLLPQRQTPFLEPYLTVNSGLTKEFCDIIGSQVTFGKSVGDYNAFAKYMPVIVFGPYGENWHGADEWVSISSIHDALAGYERFAQHLSGENI